MTKIGKQIKKYVTIAVSLFKWKRCVPIIITKEKDKLLEGKVAVVSGGSGGIGIAIARKMMSNGAKVILLGTNEAKLKRVSTELGEGLRIMCMDMNETKLFDIKVREAVEMWGKIDILVNCHGIHTKRNNLDFLNVTEDEYNSVMNINLRGTYFFCQSIARYMISSKIKGHILIISSQSALEPSWSPYRLSKLGVSGITKGIAMKLLPHGIVVNAIGPGPTNTGMQDECIRKSIYTEDNPIKRYTSPEEIAEYAVLLASHLGDTIVGDTLYMSGGRGIIDLK